MKDAYMVNIMTFKRQFIIVLKGFYVVFQMEILLISEQVPESEYHRNWVEKVLKIGSGQRDVKWTTSITAGEKEL